MAGILDSKTRILDTIITPTGRAQMATGEMNIQFASFSDRQMFYTTDEHGTLDDPGDKIYFEAYSTDADLIVQELDGDAELTPFKTDDFTLYGGSVISGSDNEQLSNVRLYAGALAADSIKSFNRQMFLGTRNLLKNEIVETFQITPSAATFYVDNIDVSETNTIASASLNDIESLWQDYRVTNVPNYQFLPPTINGTAPLGNFTNVSQTPPQSYNEVLNKLTGQQVQQFQFSNTKTTNDILGQVFEISNQKLSKLVIIDGGAYEVDDAVSPHVFYAGKLYRDTKGYLTFVNIFTLVFE